MHLQELLIARRELWQAGQHGPLLPYMCLYGREKRFAGNGLYRSQDQPSATPCGAGSGDWIALSAASKIMPWVPPLPMGATVLAGKKTVTIEIDGIWRYAAANYCCLRCGYRGEYTNPLRYTTATHLIGKPVIASTAVAIEAIKHFIDTQRHDPHYTPSAFVNCRLPVSGVSICTLVAKEGSMHRAFIGYSGSWIAADKP